MTIRVSKKPDVHVTESELRRYQDEYRRFCMFYCGTPPSLEEYIRGQKSSQSIKPGANR